MDSSKNQQKKNEQQGGKQFSTMPINEGSTTDAKFGVFNAPPGPAFVQNMPPQEGTKEQRQARKEEMNK